jgi:hypothetical protein
MTFVFFLLTLVVAGAVLICSKLVKARKRRIVLVRDGRVSTLEDIKHQHQNFSRLVQTDFGYGREVWAVASGSNEIDRRLRAFKTGVLIVPRPNHSDLQKFCQSHGIALDLMMIK